MNLIINLFRQNQITELFILMCIMYIKYSYKCKVFKVNKIPTKFAGFYKNTRHLHTYMISSYKKKVVFCM